MAAGFELDVIAVDGGGSRCRLVLDGPGGQHFAETGAANVSTDFDAALAEIRAGLAALAEAGGFSDAGLTETPAYLGLAGVTDDALAARVAAALPLARARVEDDRRAALRGALGNRDGLVAHFGTGSFFALQAAGQTRLAGGWGARLGDEASAFWVGRAALAATLETVDGLAPATGLTEALLARFGSASAIVTFAAEAPTEELAALAPAVTAAAAHGDAAGRRILGEGAAHIDAVARAMGWHPGMALCLTGGLGPEFRDYLPADLHSALIAPTGTPIDGAVVLARAFAAEATS